MPSNFPDPEKVWKIGVSLDKMVKRLYDQVLHRWNVFVLVKIQSRLHVMYKALFLCFFKVSVDHLFDNLESGKKNYCFGKSLEFWIKNLYEPWLVHVYLYTSFFSSSVNMPLLLNMCIATACLNELLLTTGSAHCRKI